MTRLRKSYTRRIALLGVLGLAAVGIVAATSREVPGGALPPAEIGVLTENYGALVPPPIGAAPGVPGDAAVETAALSFSPTFSADRVVARLAEDESGRLVWAVFFSGACVPVSGPAGMDRTDLPECAGDGWLVAVDATTGQPDDGIGNFYGLPT